MNFDWVKLNSFLFCVFVFCLHGSFINEWEPTYHIWDFGIIQLCNKGRPSKPIDYFSREPVFSKEAYQSIKAGDIVWVHCKFLQRFVEEVLNGLEVPIVIVISDGDESFPSDCGRHFNVESFLDRPCVKKVFAQNCDYQGKNSKVERIPIGMDFHTIAYKSVNGGWGEKGMPIEQEGILQSILRHAQPTHKRIRKAFVDFHKADTMHGEFKRYLQFGEDRASIFRRLLPTGLIDHAGWMKRSKLWETKAKYAFSISPHGNGLDCHRTWEDLILGCIVIVKTSPLDPLYEGLPVVIVNDWDEVTSDNLTRWLKQYGDAFDNPSYREKLTHKYWFSKIVAAATRYKP